ncbi:MAG: BON domain-containing protein [Blastocatellia bacterium]|nr:BON domain-containing protein [Blastocatellia bacterium]
MSSVLICPICNTKQSDKNNSCRHCSADLSLLARLNDLALDYYDEALPLARTEATIEEAMEKLQLALSIDPGHIDSQVVLGKLYAQRGDYEEAIRFWRRVLESVPDDSEAGQKARTGIAKAEELLQRQSKQKEQIERQGFLAERTALRRRRMFTAATAFSAFLLGVLVIAYPFILHPRLSAEDPALQVQRALQEHPTLSDAQLRVSARNNHIVIEGTVSSPLHKDLVTSVAQQSAARLLLDTSNLQVQLTDLAATLEQMLSALPGTLGSNVGAGNGKDLIDALATAQITVTPTTDDRLRLTGTAALPEVKKVIEQVAFDLAGRDRVDASGIQIVDDYIEYVVKENDSLERIARRLCGDSQRSEAIRRFSKENTEALKDSYRLRMGAVLKIPKRLLAKPTRR